MAEEEKKEKDTVKQPNEEATQKKEEPKQEKKVQEVVSKEEYIKLKYQFSEYMNKFKEYEHEFENYKRRTREEIKQAKQDGIEKAVETILPALDTFKKAKSLITDKSSLSGIALIEKNILAELNKLNVKKIECIGKPFNADYHNAVMLLEDKTKKSGIVIDEVEAGYTLNDKVIKYSKVVVTK